MNSSNFIVKTLEKLSAEVRNYKFSTEIILVDDNSTDDTTNQLISFAENNPDINLLLAKSYINYGQSISTMTGIRVSKGEHIVIFDDDLQYDVKDISKLLECISQNQSLKMVCGHRRINKNQKTINKILRFISVLLLSFFFPFYRNKKYFTSFKVFKKELFFNNDNSFNNQNIFYFWTVTPDTISAVNVNHFKSIRNKTNYTILKMIWEFHYLIIKLTQRIIIWFTFLLILKNLFIKKPFSASETSLYIFLFITYFFTFISLKIKNAQMLNAKYHFVHEYA